MNQSELKKALLDHLSSYDPRSGDALSPSMYVDYFTEYLGIGDQEMAALIQSLTAHGYFCERDKTLWFSTKWPIG